jgi:hypothetical protein
VDAIAKSRSGKPTPRPPDPAERTGYLRWFYRNWRPTWMGRAWSGLFARISALGLTPAELITLQVRDRTSGQLRSTVLVAAEHEKGRYVVSMLGDRSEWVRNLRASQGEAVIRRRSPRRVRLIEVPVAARAPILKAWCQVADSGRRHLPVAPDEPVSSFEAIAEDYPVFRIEAVAHPPPPALLKSLSPPAPGPAAPRPSRSPRR